MYVRASKRKSGFSEERKKSVQVVAQFTFQFSVSDLQITTPLKTGKQQKIRSVMRKYLNVKHGKAREAIIDLVKLKKSLTTAVLSSCITGALAERRSQFYANIGQCSRVWVRVLRSHAIEGQRWSNGAALKKHASSERERGEWLLDVNGAFDSWALS